MSKLGNASREFGCETCWPNAPVDAYAAVYKVPGRTLLFDDSHFIVNCCTCPDCGQSFVFVFTETVDFDGGEDQQHRSIMPVTAGELSGLPADGRGLEVALGALAPERRSLQFDWPSGGIKSVTWGKGIVVGPHD